MKKSFTLVELIVTISIISLLAVISFAMLPVYKRKANIDAVAQETKDLFVKVQNLALSPESYEGTNTAQHYILFLNTHEEEKRTPLFMAKPLGNACYALEPNGGYCIAEEYTKGSELKNSVSIVSYAPSCPVPTGKRRSITRGRINAGSIEIGEIFLAQGDGESGYGCDDYYCNNEGDICSPQGQDEFSDSCCCLCETGLLKIHFRAWDGQIGINGLYYDVNSEQWNNAGFTSSELEIELEKGDERKTLKINLISGKIYLE